MSIHQATHQVIWKELNAQAKTLAQQEPLLESYYFSSILNHTDFEKALSHHLAVKLHTPAVSELLLNEVFLQVLEENPGIATAALDDLAAYFDRDPACDSYCRPFLYFKGYMAIQAYRFAHHLWVSQRQSLARYLQHQSSLLFDVDIHPSATIGTGIMFDHATGIVVGETAVVGNDVSMLHGVTLGGCGNKAGQRHPKIGNGVMISCGAKIIGNIVIGDGVKIGGGSLVLESVPEQVTIVGVPAKIVGHGQDQLPAFTMDQSLQD